jgi:aquaporin related protein
LVHPNNTGATTTLSDGISIAQGFFFEMFTTTVLTMAVFILVVEEKERVLASFGIGMTLFVTVLCSGPFTGASSNPARTFGTSIIWNVYGRAHWIYYFGPLLGSLLAYILWYLLKILMIFESKNDNEDDNNDKDRV